MAMKRRAVLTAMAGSLLMVGYLVLSPQTSNARLISPVEARELMDAGSIILVDIRRSDEWKLTGVAQGAHPIDMRDKDFLDQILALVGRDTTRGLALICARGVRSRNTAARLEAAGFSNLFDVSEGMLGSASGPGWINRELPLIAFDAK